MKGRTLLHMKKAIIVLFVLVFGLSGYFEYRIRQVQEYASKCVVPAAKKKSMLLAEEAGDKKVWWRNGLIGGGDNLDGIDDDNLTDGDVALVATISGSTVNMWWYIYDQSDTTTSEDSTNYTVIAPDTGVGRWLLCNMNGATITSKSSGDHYFQILQAGTPSSLSEGMIWYDSTDNRLEYYNGTNTVYIQPSGSLVGTE